MKVLENEDFSKETKKAFSQNLWVKAMIRTEEVFVDLHWTQPALENEAFTEDLETDQPEADD